MLDFRKDGLDISWWVILAPACCLLVVVFVVAWIVVVSKVVSFYFVRVSLTIHSVFLFFLTLLNTLYPISWGVSFFWLGHDGFWKCTQRTRALSMRTGPPWLLFESSGVLKERGRRIIRGGRMCAWTDLISIIHHHLCHSYELGSLSLCLSLWVTHLPRCLRLIVSVS